MSAINNLHLQRLVNHRRFGRLLLNLTKLNPHFFRHVLNTLYGRGRRYRHGSQPSALDRPTRSLVRCAGPKQFPQAG